MKSLWRIDCRSKVLGCCLFEPCLLWWKSLRRDRVRKFIILDRVRKATKNDLSMRMLVHIWKHQLLLRSMLI